MVGDPAPERSSVVTIHYQAREQLARLEREPFVARIIVRWEDEETPREETIYIARASVIDITSSLPKLKLASYRAALGRLAEFDAGDKTTIQLGYKTHEVSILERITLRPDFAAGEWDALEDVFDFETWVHQIESVRRFLEQQARALLSTDLEIPDVLGELLDEIDAVNVAVEGSRRRVIERISLRDQPILNRYQGEVFRMPLEKRLVLFGPPGTGKTTTLIRRLAQKRTYEALTGEELGVLSNSGLERDFLDSHSWAMFSPTELLKLYLRDAFNREGVPASDINLKTWEKERLDLGKNVLRLLRSPEGGRFQLDDTDKILSDGSSEGVIRLYEEFSSFIEKETLGQFTEAFSQLQRSEDEQLKKLVRNAVGQSGSGLGFSLHDLSNLLEEGSQLQPELRRIDGSIKQEVHSIANRLVYVHKTVLDELVQALPSITLEGSVEEDEDDEEEADEATLVIEPRNTQEAQRLAVDILKGTVRSMARSAALKRSKVGGRAGRVVGLLGDRTPSRKTLAKLGDQILRMAHLRRLINSPRRYVMGIPQAYRRFRRHSLREGRLFAGASGDAIKQNRISGSEVDVLILAMLRNARKLFHEKPSQLTQLSLHDWLENIKSQYLMQVFVDEATDFSAVQLASMMELSHPKLRSWFACGDLNQRITSHGVRDMSEIEWLKRMGGDPIELRELNIAYRQSHRLRELANTLSASSGSGTPLIAPESGEDGDVWPLLGENLKGDTLATWLSERIIEVERSVGKLPSIALFVDGEAPIAPLVNLLHPLLAKHNIPVVGCGDGRVVGDNLEVRVFDVRHIKGLEFEAVFFVGIDTLARSMPDLFERFFYVGASRAATYLGVTCERQLPSTLEHVRGHFLTNNW
jgi:superfamily I DNA/RNA helicase